MTTQGIAKTRTGSERFVSGLVMGGSVFSLSIQPLIFMIFSLGKERCILCLSLDMRR